MLRRHVPENLEAYRRWYRDPEVARLARYQDGPMGLEEIDRFFHARALGDETMDEQRAEVAAAAGDERDGHRSSP